MNDHTSQFVQGIADEIIKQVTLRTEFLKQGLSNKEKIDNADLSIDMINLHLKGIKEAVDNIVKKRTIKSK